MDRPAGDADVATDDGDVVDVEPDEVGDGRDAEVGDGGPSRPEERGSDPGDDLVDEPCAQEGRREGGSALEPGPVDPAPPEVGDDGVGVVRAQEHRVGRVVEDVGGRRDLPLADDHAQGLASHRPVVRVAHGEPGVVLEHGPRPDDDGATAAALVVHLPTCSRPGDPPARAVGRG